MTDAYCEKSNENIDRGKQPSSDWFTSFSHIVLPKFPNRVIYNLVLRFFFWQKHSLVFYVVPLCINTMACFCFRKKNTVCIFLITWFVLFKINYLLSVFNAGVGILILNYSQRYPCRDITCVSYVKTLKQTFELSTKSDEHKFDK